MQPAIAAGYVGGNNGQMRHLAFNEATYDGISVSLSGCIMCYAVAAMQDG
jgi:hypothetical protein